MTIPLFVNITVKRDISERGRDIRGVIEVFCSFVTLPHLYRSDR